MRLIKLVHPVLGLCAQEVIYPNNTIPQITTRWKYRYGKKFYECTVEFESDEVVPLPSKDSDIEFKEPLAYTKITDAIIQKVLQLFHAGFKGKYISEQLGISLSTVNRIRINKKDNNNTYYIVNGQKLTA